jgi:circadian clock protein KaiC
MAVNDLVIPAARGIEKVPTGIAGLDEITFGGLPRGRPTLVIGTSGSGKTLLAMQFLVNGATIYGEPGVYVAFEETADELAANFRSLGIDLESVEQKGLIAVDHVHIDRGEIEQSGAYDLEGLFIRLNSAIDSIGARRVVLDTIEVLFAGLPDDAILRAEVKRLFRWLKEKNVTAVITGERRGALAAQGLEEFVSDCVIALENHLSGEVTTRRLRVAKYRGSQHGTNNYPFLIDAGGISIAPVTSIGLEHDATVEHVSSGVARLDTMLEGKGYYRGSSVLVSGTPGAGKTSLAAHFLNAGCARGEKAVFAAYEESPAQIMRNMRSIGIDLAQWVDKGLLSFHAVRPSSYGLETHLSVLHRILGEKQVSLFVADPITNLTSVGSQYEVGSTLRRLVDMLKSRGITGLFTALSPDYGVPEPAETGVSSLMDTWLVLRDIEANGERTRGIYVRKSRGMSHSNQIREFLLTGHGIDLEDVYIGPAGVLTGSARLAQETTERTEAEERQRSVERTRANLERRKRQLDRRMEALRLRYEEDAAGITRQIEEAEASERQRGHNRTAMARKRWADTEGNHEQS